MFGMNVMAWNGGDLEKLELLQNRVERLALGALKWMAVGALEGDLGWNISGMRYEECNMTVVDAMKDFFVHAWNKRH
ncbi:hypothetical protein FHG87_005318 [Trinorchestia longiramus]|nr:hypothetical protein FHG87_005318 [Trinorchestia longiramus]